MKKILNKFWLLKNLFVKCDSIVWGYEAKRVTMFTFYSRNLICQTNFSKTKFLVSLHIIGDIKIN